MTAGAAIAIRPIGRVRSTRAATGDDGWDAEQASIELDDAFEPEALAGLEAFSHAEIFFVFDRVAEDAVERGARHPRGNPDWPRVGIFAQRGKDRPNRLGATIVEIVSRSGRTLVVHGLDAVDGTPVVDIKPVMAEFLPRSAVRQPAWSQELMRRYWS
ncbi:MAG TPA: SAM-dependent methyltransferase [Vicinamibacterales bacterium]|nr:SAM-dependent methyltransferase [Vicinamibacterales bacterium]